MPWRTDDATSGRIYIKDLLETLILRAGASPEPVGIRELDDEAVSFGELASNLSANMSKTDAHVFTMVVAACQKGKKRPEILKLIRTVWLWS